MTAHDDKIRRAGRFADQRDLDTGVGIERSSQRVDGEKTVGLGEGSNGA